MANVLYGLARRMLLKRMGFGANSIVEGGWGVVCQLVEREIASGDEGFVELRGWWGVDMGILGCFRKDYFRAAAAKDGWWKEASPGQPTSAGSPGGCEQLSDTLAGLHSFGFAWIMLAKIFTLLNQS